MAKLLVVGSRNRPSGFSEAELREAAEALVGGECRDVSEPLTRWARLVYLVDFEPGLRPVQRHVLSM